MTNNQQQTAVAEFTLQDFSRFFHSLTVFELADKGPHIRAKSAFVWHLIAMWELFKVAIWELANASQMPEDIKQAKSLVLLRTGRAVMQRSIANENGHGHGEGRSQEGETEEHRSSSQKPQQH